MDSFALEGYFDLPRKISHNSLHKISPEAIWRTQPAKEKNWASKDAAESSRRRRCQRCFYSFERSENFNFVIFTTLFFIVFFTGRNRPRNYAYENLHKR